MDKFDDKPISEAVRSKAVNKNSSLFNCQSAKQTGKETCDETAYLFWKIQSRLAKLSNRLRAEQHIILDEQTNRSKNNSLTEPCQDQDD